MEQLPGTSPVQKIHETTIPAGQEDSLDNQKSGWRPCFLRGSELPEMPGRQRIQCTTFMHPQRYEYSHLEQALRVGVINIQQLADSSQIASISIAWNGLAVGEKNLTNLSAVMNSAISFGLLKCVTTSLKEASQPNDTLKPVR